jgi:hypothetical protein
MNHRLVAIILLVLLVVILISIYSFYYFQYGNSQTQVVTRQPTLDTRLTSTYASQMALNWIKGNPCKAPCWEGIYPGQTSFRDALSILRADARFDGTKINISEDDNYDLIEWEDAKNPFYADWVIYIEKKKQTVAFIKFATDKHFVLGDVVSGYGNPSDVLATSGLETNKLYDYHYDLVLIYLDDGFFIKAQRTNSPFLPKISIDTNFRFVTIFHPDGKSMEIALEYSFGKTAKYISSWKGFLDYTDYCYLIGGDRGLAPLCK